MSNFKETESYVADFESFALKSAKDDGLALLRAGAIERFSKLGFPTTRDEEWRFTNVAPIAKASFARAQVNGTNDEAAGHFLLGLTSNKLVFINGHYVDSLSSVNRLPKGAVAGSLATALASKNEIATKHLGKYASFENHAFAALNTAFIEDGAFVYVPNGTIIEEPLHLVFFSTGAGVSYPRNLFVAGENSQCTIIETYSGIDGGAYFTNAVTEVFTGQNANVDHYKLQQESLDAFHVASLQIHQERTSNFSSHSFGFGGALVRNDIGTVLAGEGCNCILNGLYMTAGHQVADNHTRIDHAMPHCETHELYKGIMDDHSRAVFNGRIMVRQDAQKTNSKQTNKNLLLSNTALVNTNPQLEIFADDVKCTHGATIGQLDEDSIFYLRSRGISLADSRRLLTYAFANDVIERVKVEPLRAELERILMETQNESEARHLAEIV